MIYGKILDNNKVYISPIFAISSSMRNAQIVIFDANYTKLIVKNLYENYKNSILFISYDYSDFAYKEERFKSYWNNKNLINVIKLNNYSNELFEEAKMFLNSFPIKDYYPINVDLDLEGLDINVGGFHDAYILGIMEKENYTEMLINTTWGSLVSLKCIDVIKNELKVGDSFSYCNMKVNIEENINSLNVSKIILFSFDSFNGKELELVCHHLEYDPIFAIRINKLKYNVSDKELVVFDNKRKHIINTDNINNKYLDLKERKIIGYYQNDENTEWIIFLKDYALNYCIYFKKNQNHIDEFKKDCLNYGYKFDDFPFVDYAGPSFEEVYGELVLKKDYGNKYKIYEMIKYVYIVPLVWTFMWLLIKLTSPKMEWRIFAIMGLISLGIYILITLIIILKGLLSKKDYDRVYLEVRQNGIIYNTLSNKHAILYEDIEKVQFDKRIIIQSKFVQIKLYKSSDDREIFELLKSKINKI